MKASPGEIRVLQSTTASAVPTGAGPGGEGWRASRAAAAGARRGFACCQGSSRPAGRTLQVPRGPCPPGMRLLGAVTPQDASPFRACTFLPFNYIWEEQGCKVEGRKWQSLAHGLLFRRQWREVGAGNVIVQLLPDLPCCSGLFEGHNILQSFNQKMLWWLMVLAGHCLHQHCSVSPEPGEMLRLSYSTLCPHSV